jgi:hypothetical protein
MLAVCSHTESHITTSPQTITLHGSRATVDVTIALTATCRDGHQHTLYVTDIDDVDQASRELNKWVGDHVDNCPGVNSSLMSA